MFGKEPAEPERVSIAFGSIQSTVRRGQAGMDHSDARIVVNADTLQSSTKKIVVVFGAKPRGVRTQPKRFVK